jgi:hypothetical protein
MVGLERSDRQESSGVLAAMLRRTALICGDKWVEGVGNLRTKCIARTTGHTKLVCAEALLQFQS